MNFMTMTKLPTAEEIIRQYPLSAQGSAQVLAHREEIKAILAGLDPRLLIIVGPCSAWPRPAVLEYAARLSQLNQQVKGALKIVMRMYIQKPRTTKGWTGPMNHPDPFGEPDLLAGIAYVRQMMVEVVEMGLPIADECLFTHNTGGFADLVSWFAIGARSSEDHEHRMFASAANCPVGLKNPTHGNLAVAVNSVVAAQHGHTAAMNGYEVKTFGNPYAHLVLRGANQKPNYTAPFLVEIQEQMQRHAIKNPAILIDVSHDNCLINGQKNHLAQGEILLECLTYLKKRPDLAALVKGFMIESYLKDGNQQVERCSPVSLDWEGLSITDPCLGWEKTEALLLQLSGGKRM
jgi:3-deoxy-7-phosphoheptulonate synthase